MFVFSSSIQYLVNSIRFNLLIYAIAPFSFLGISQLQGELAALKLAIKHQSVSAVNRFAISH